MFSTSRASDDDHDGDPPCTAGIGQEASIGVALGLLNQAGRGEHTAFAINNAMHAIVAPRNCGTSPISPEQRDDLLQAAIRAEVQLIGEFAGVLDDEDMHLGMRALSQQIVRLADAPRARRPDEEDPTNSRARILRNLLHNEDLREMMRGEGRAVYSRTPRAVVGTGRKR